MKAALLQIRSRPVGDDTWSQWTECTEDDFRRIERKPILGGHEYEVRELFAFDPLTKGFDAFPEHAPLTLPMSLDLNDALREILGRPCFTCIKISELLRRTGVPIKRKAEDEQATVIHFALLHYIIAGDNWVESATADLQARVREVENADALKFEAPK